MVNDHKICPVEKAGKLDKWWRKLLHNPKKLFGKYINKDMNVADIGCGPGFFTIEMAKLVGNGKVIAVDLQQEMLDILKNKIEKANIKNIELHKCTADKIGLAEKVDFALAFYIVHEVPDIANFLKEIYEILKKGSILYIAEPAFHVSKKEFKETIDIAEKTSFRIIEKPKILFSRTVVFKK